jgi:hypothetical protein
MYPRWYRASVYPAFTGRIYDIISDLSGVVGGISRIYLCLYCGNIGIFHHSWCSGYGNSDKIGILSFEWYGYIGNIKG